MSTTVSREGENPNCTHDPPEGLGSPFLFFWQTWLLFLCKCHPGEGGWERGDLVSEGRFEDPLAAMVQRKNHNIIRPPLI